MYYLMVLQKRSHDLALFLVDHRRFAREYRNIQRPMPLKGTDIIPRASHRRLLFFCFSFLSFFFVFFLRRLGLSNNRFPIWKRALSRTAVCDGDRRRLLADLLVFFT